MGKLNMRDASARILSLGESVKDVLSVVTDLGGHPFLVGGCVRDSVLGISPEKADIDLEIYGIDDLGSLLLALGYIYKTAETGKAFSVLKVSANGAEVDIALPRQERKTGAGHRGFAVMPDGSLDFATASARRNFTVNSMLADPRTGAVIDCHDGLRDLEKGILRHTSEAFSEDPLRVLIAVQLSARFGFRLAPETGQLCRSLSGSYHELPVERVWHEFEKMAELGKHLDIALDTLARSGWEKYFPAISMMHGIPQDAEWHPEGDVHVHSGMAATQAARMADEAGLTGEDRLVIVLAALLHDAGKVTHTQVTGQRITAHGHAQAGVIPAQSFLREIGCPERVISRILPLIREHMSCLVPPTKPAVRRLARRLPPATLAELALVIGADRAGRGGAQVPNPADAWLEMARDLTVTESPRKGILTGHHLIAAGMEPGPAFTPVLASALEAQDEGEFEDEEGALRWLRMVMTKNKNREDRETAHHLGETALLCPA